MDKPIQMAIGVGLAIAAMAIVGVYVFGVIGGSTVSTDIVPKTLDAISSNQGKSLQISAALNNQGSGSIASVGAVLRVDVKEMCGPGLTTSPCTMRGSMKDALVSGVIYFPVSYSETVVESFNTINIRASIESEGPKGAGDALDRSGVGCDVPLNVKVKLSSEAGFTSLDDAINYFKAKDLKITKSDTATAEVTGSGEGVTVGENNVVCARNLGIFAGEEITLTVIGETTSGESIERIIPLTVR